jgi:hypothetical protein
VLDLSKIEAGKLELNPQTVQLASLINDVISTTGQLAEQNKNRLVVDAQENLGALTVDPMRLWQILLNLLSNACKFTKQGEITLRARRVANGGNWIELAVADTGIGMTAEQQAKRRHRQAPTKCSRQERSSSCSRAVRAALAVQPMCYLDAKGHVRSRPSAPRFRTIMAGFSYSRFCSRGRSHKQCEQCNHTHSDNQYCECYGS